MGITALPAKLKKVIAERLTYRNTRDVESVVIAINHSIDSGPVYATEQCPIVSSSKLVLRRQGG